MRSYAAVRGVCCPLHSIQCLNSVPMAPGKPLAWARSSGGWACLLIWACKRRHVLGARRHARWGWYLYDKEHLRDEPDIYAGRPGASFGVRYLPGYEAALAEASAALAELAAPRR